MRPSLFPWVSGTAIFALCTVEEGIDFWIHAKTGLRNRSIERRSVWVILSFLAPFLTLLLHLYID